jgi:hypothetical protein
MPKHQTSKGFSLTLPIFCQGFETNILGKKDSPQYSRSFQQFFIF